MNADNTSDAFQLYLIKLLILTMGRSKKTCHLSQAINNTPNSVVGNSVGERSLKLKWNYMYSALGLKFVSLKPRNKILLGSTVY